MEALSSGAGSYFVKGHFKTIKGNEHYWQAHCRKGKTRKNVLNFDEIQHIVKQFNEKELVLPKSYDFNTIGNFGNKFDLIIAGWV